MTFKSVVSAVSEQCQEVRQALASFTYFETWGPDVIGECCRISSIAEFSPDRIILGPDNGNSHTVYFILEGVCKMVQHMHFQIKTGRSRVGPGRGELFQCKRYRYSDSRISNSESNTEGYKSRLLNKGYDFHTAEIEHRGEAEESQPVELPDEESKEKGGEAGEGQPADLPHGELKENGDEGEESQPAGLPDKELEENGGKGEESQPTDLPDQEQEETGGESHPEGLPDEKLEENGQGEVLVKESEGTFENAPNGGSAGEGDQKGGNGEKTPIEDPNSEFSEEARTEIPEVNYEPDHHLKVLEECKKRRNETISVCKKGVLPEKVKNVRSVFVQTGFLLKGACFGLEKCENFIMSSTKVKCLKIPQRFLLKNNPCNIWNRIRLFHTLYLPKDDRIFENFRTHRMWTERKKKLSEEIVSAKNSHNYTLNSDVPYSIRLVEVR